MELQHLTVDQCGENRARIEQVLRDTGDWPLDEDTAEVVEAFLAGRQKLVQNG